MKDYPVADLEDETYFSKPVYLDQGFVLTAPEIPVSLAMKAALKAWGFTTLRSDGEPVDEYSRKAALPDPESPAVVFKDTADIEEMVRAKTMYLQFQRYVSAVFTEIQINVAPSLQEMSEKVKDVCDFIKQDRRYILRELRNAEPETEQNYLVSHTAKSVILSIIIGSYLKLAGHRVIELGVAALLHEAGMIRLPPSIYMNKRSLNAAERRAILAHPALGYNVLKSFNLPLAVTIPALEHHERENGGGYPLQLTGDKISLYSKIIAVACSYEAQTSLRPHKSAKDGFEGMVELLKNVGKQYDDTVIRALVFSLSIYPIGLYVLLSNGKKGQVVDVDPEHPRYPLVQVLGVLTPEGKAKIQETSQDGVHIVRPLVRDELG
ncbi:MAG: HD-GYP domain-containing protein [Treponema sp.]|jgi:HD-GYP domain-containing protein (c-di-GMP phosphodiesterase class II)|nr:HD-GYP domain-containing protein [Treponema sp.]